MKETKMTGISKKEIEKETEKALAIYVHVGRGEWWDIYSIWIPKSLITFEEDHIEFPEWIMRKNAETLKNKYNLDYVGLGRDNIYQIA